MTLSIVLLTLEDELPLVKWLKYIHDVTASRGVTVLQRDIGIDSNQAGGVNEFKYRRRQQVIE